jgi:hypothetical protein
METLHEEDWDTLKSLFPDGWIELGKSLGAIKRLREFKSPEVLMRVLLIHLIKGYSLRETATLASQTGLATVSDVTILNRLRGCEKWLHELTLTMIKSKELNLNTKHYGYNLKLVDATRVKEPGKTGSEWYLHYCVDVPGLNCDYFDITPRKGNGNGETLKRFPASSNDLLIGDRGYCTRAGIRSVKEQGGDVLIRWAPSNLPMKDLGGNTFEILSELKSVKRAGQMIELEGMLDIDSGIPLRACIIRKTKAAIEASHKKVKRHGQKGQHVIKPETWEYAKYVMVIMTVSKEKISTKDILELYRMRWQIELVFRRFKSIASFGHLPKRDPVSSRSWLYGKLFASLLAERLAITANSISPWGLMGGQRCDAE